MLEPRYLYTIEAVHAPYIGIDLIAQLEYLDANGWEVVAMLPYSPQDPGRNGDPSGWVPCIVARKPRESDAS